MYCNKNKANWFKTCPVLLTIDGSVTKVTDSVYDLVIILRVDMSMKDQIVQWSESATTVSSSSTVCVLEQPMMFYINVEVNNTLYIARYYQIMVLASRAYFCVDNTELIS